MKVTPVFLFGAHGDTPFHPNSPDIPVCSHEGQALDDHTCDKHCLLRQSCSRGPVSITLSTSICIPGRTEVKVDAQLPKSCSDQLGMVTPASDNEAFPSNIFPAYSVSQANSRHIPVRLMNTASFDIELQLGQKVGEFCPLVASPENITSCTVTSNSTSSTYSTIQHELEKSLSPS